ncbi:alpha-ketoglutarate-dependent dioxygenase AlkB family protein [Chryseolinea lacunae]|uniref:Alpha-ketoglutarate-dependent dioxygenase AlkB n=1 Tax=Chryseolinea lacunae TaxID=2801331 RepID=A0ABS1KJV3_9BACT|nr:alpha-ketoglutarate-dependent dioxygenase AlkB [Chryseolinea lacunae]MBL0739625.1 alpha-ketoglutarate-dependent dioxygenase AlkB [Chryseolinea lacunae]
MDQLSMFGEGGKSEGLPQDVLAYTPALFNAHESSTFLGALIADTPWEQRVVKMYGKEMLTPRLTAWYGDENKNYAYTGNRFHPLPWTPALLAIKERIEPLSGVRFNSVLLNYYRDGNDSVAWHADDETELGKQPVIASVSFGQMRRFDIRHKINHDRKYSVRLENGSLLLMKGDLQQHWEHRVAKSTTPMKARVNLTFRIIQ